MVVAMKPWSAWREAGKWSQARAGESDVRDLDQSFYQHGPGSHGNATTVDTHVL